MAALIQVVTQGVEHVLVDGFARGERQRAHGLADVAGEPDRELLDGYLLPTVWLMNVAAANISSADQG
jgi:hypothetical protein